MEWHHKGSTAHKKFKTQLSAGKIMASVFLDSEEAIYTDFLPHTLIINAHYHNNLLHSDVHRAVQKKNPWQNIKEHHSTT
jgi:hypothetical protein